MPAATPPLESSKCLTKCCTCSKKYLKRNRLLDVKLSARLFAIFLALLLQDWLLQDSCSNQSPDVGVWQAEKHCTNYASFAKIDLSEWKALNRLLYVIVRLKYQYLVSFSLKVCHRSLIYNERDCLILNPEAAEMVLSMRSEGQDVVVMSAFS